jgi:uncharacterized protein YdeI (YjbR/CyaY-like superfamily)
MAVGSDLDVIEPSDRPAWRAWLAANHTTARGCWLIVPRVRGAAPGPSYEEAVEEALCFGWIDGRMQPLDERRLRQHFAPRKRGGTWARSNKQRVERLEAEGLMTDVGRRVIEAAKRDGSWNALDEIDSLVIPDDLAAALASNPVASANFERFSASIKRGFLWWIKSAKRPDTRLQRIADTVWLAERDIREPRRIIR